MFCARSNISSIPDEDPVLVYMAIPIDSSDDLIVLTDLPAGVIIGYDTKSLTLAESKKLLGLKEVPKGVHFVWAGSRDNSRRSGFWIITPSEDDAIRNVIIKQWDVGLEGLIRYVASGHFSFCSVCKES